jgi:hypothetical protein
MNWADTSAAWRKGCHAYLNLTRRHMPNAFTCIADIDAFTDILAIIADWRDELQTKLERAVLRFEVSGLTPEEQALLSQEVFAFVSLCSALADNLGSGT